MSYPKRFTRDGLTPYEDRLREAFPDAEKVRAEVFDFGDKIGVAVQMTPTRRYAVRVKDSDIANLDAAIAELREWFAGLPA